MPSVVGKRLSMLSTPAISKPGVAGEGAATGAELYVGHGTVWVNGDNGYIAMQVSGLEVLPGPVSRIQVIVPAKTPSVTPWIRDKLLIMNL